MAPSALNESTKEAAGVPSGFILKLYQMVNGAPDEVISWTPSGDAFRIGADLQRLESETLPHYFRHSRFQSLVRQLNFYNFRKVNRERTFWIYRHRLFHRDKPQDLHLLRRRTCPGVDGRKNRFSRDGEDVDEARKNSDDEDHTDESSLEISYHSAEEEPHPEEAVTPAPPKPILKKRMSLPMSSATDSKKPRRVPKEKSIVEDNVDLSMVSPDRPPVVHEEEAEPLVSSDVERDERTERRVQSHVVSQVAMKLEEYAKKAKRGTRARGGRIGSVTPPSLGGGTVMASGHNYRSLITYDDEYDATNFRHSSHASVTGIVTDGDDSMTSEEEYMCRVVSEVFTPTQSEKVVFSKAPVENVVTIEKVTNLFLAKSDVATAAIAGFCMSTPPLDTPDLCSKVLRLLSSCDTLAMEFQQYRSALHPVDNFSMSGLPPNTFTQGFRKHDAVSVQQIWERAGSRVDAVRDFKTFAVNMINAGLEQKLWDFNEQEEVLLKNTADTWLKSVVMN